MLVQCGTQITGVYVGQFAWIFAVRPEHPLEPREVFLEYQIYEVDIESVCEHRLEEAVSRSGKPTPSRHFEATRWPDAARPSDIRSQRMVLIFAGAKRRKRSRL